MDEQIRTAKQIEQRRQEGCNLANGLYRALLDDPDISEDTTKTLKGTKLERTLGVEKGGFKLSARKSYQSGYLFAGLKLEMKGSPLLEVVKSCFWNWHKLDREGYTPQDVSRYTPQSEMLSWCKSYVNGVQRRKGTRLRAIKSEESEEEKSRVADFLRESGTYQEQEAERFGL